MKRKLLGSALLAAAVVPWLASVAHAGLKSNSPVYVDLTFSVAHGSTGSARKAANSTEYIECRTGAQSEYGLIECAAVNAAGVTAYCYAEDNSFPEGQQLGDLPLMADGAYLSFSWAPDGRCTAIMVAVSSDNEPKRP